jgi:FkbM family methyltransferase
MGMLGVIRQDFASIARVCGTGTALRWLANIALHFPKCYRERSLTAADRAMGDGPFQVRYLDRARAIIHGNTPFGGLREIWVRDVYLRNQYLTIDDGDVVVDVGSHQGLFTLLALGHGPNVRTISVEASPGNAANLRRQLAANGWEGRTQICNAFLGAETSYQTEMKAQGDAAPTPFLSEADFVARYDVTRIDLLKVDIEGSEYGLLTPESKLLAMAGQLTLEAHNFCGDPKALAEILTRLGFEMSEPFIHNGCWLIQARRPGR